MIQFCVKSIAFSLKLVFNSVEDVFTLEEGVSPEDSKNRNVMPVHKKDCKSLIKNYLLISLLPMLKKVFERLIFSPMFNYFMEKKLLPECQSSFIPGDSCVAQLLSLLMRSAKISTATHHLMLKEHF